MARKGVLGFCWRRLPSVLFRTQRAARRLLLLAFILPLSFFPLRAQLQQPFVFSTDLTNPSSIDVYTRNDITGVLTPLVGSPFPSREPVSVMTLDFKGRFLFTASSNVSKISMFTVNPDRERFKRFPIRRLLPLRPTDQCFSPRRALDNFSMSSILSARSRMPAPSRPFKSIRQVSI